MKQGKMHYLNFRTLCAWSFMVLFLAALLGYLIYEKSGEWGRLVPGIFEGACWCLVSAML